MFSRNSRSSNACVDWRKDKGSGGRYSVKCLFRWVSFAQSGCNKCMTKVCVTLSDDTLNKVTASLVQMAYWGRQEASNKP